MVKKTIDDLNLKQILDSGQCFRMVEEEPGVFTTCAYGRFLKIRQNKNQFEFFCGEEEFHNIWSRYFDLDTDYKKIKSAVDPKDEYLNAAIQYGDGIRILRQEPWEMIISFMISQNNNIPRIRKSIELLCEIAGKKCGTPDGMIYHVFPTAQEIYEIGMEGLSRLGLGYRDKYLYKMASAMLEGGFDLTKLVSLDHEGAHKMLTEQYGIGNKVADCIYLFGLHHIDAFPVDTHVKKIMENHYQNGFPFEKYNGFAGAIQQYMFYYDLKKDGEADRKKVKNKV